MLLLALRELLENGVFSGKQFEAFFMSATITDFSILIASIFYLLMGIVPSAKIRKGDVKK